MSQSLPEVRRKNGRGDTYPPPAVRISIPSSVPVPSDPQNLLLPTLELASTRLMRAGLTREAASVDALVLALASVHRAMRSTHLPGDIREKMEVFGKWL